MPHRQGEEPELIGPLVDRQAGLLRELEARPDADTDHDEIGLEPRSVVEHDGIAFDPLRRVAEMEHDAVFKGMPSALVQESWRPKESGRRRPVALKLVYHRLDGDSMSGCP